MFFLVLLVQKRAFTNHLSSQGSVFEIILSCRCPLSLSFLCSFSLPSLLQISVWTLCLFPAGSLMWNSLKYWFVGNVHSATFIPFYFGCLQVLVFSASVSITILKWRHPLLYYSPFWCSLLIGLLNGVPSFLNLSPRSSASWFKIRS